MLPLHLSRKSSPDSAHQTTRESLLVRSAVTAFVSKIYLVGYLRYIGFDENKRV